jgi:hypothetical protein
LEGKLKGRDQEVEGRAVTMENQHRWKRYQLDHNDYEPQREFYQLDGLSVDKRWIGTFDKKTPYYNWDKVLPNHNPTGYIHELDQYRGK